MELTAGFLFRGSWGSLPPLVYAQAHNQHVLGCILRGVFHLFTRREVDWFCTVWKIFFLSAHLLFIHSFPKEGETVGRNVPQLMSSILRYTSLQLISAEYEDACAHDPYSLSIICSAR